MQHILEIFLVLCKCRTSESSQQKHYTVKAGLVGLVSSEMTALQLMKGLDLFGG